MITSLSKYILSEITRTLSLKDTVRLSGICKKIREKIFFRVCTSIFNSVQLYKYPLLIKKDIDKYDEYDYFKDTQLISLCKNGPMEEKPEDNEGFKFLIGILLKAGANPNYLNFAGGTPLFYAFYNNNRSLIMQLLENGADPEIKNNDGNNILHWASRYEEHKDNIELLIAISDMNLDLPGEFDNTALYKACCYGNFGVVKILLENGANPDITDCFGITPLMKAIKRGDNTIVKLLLENNADPDIRSNAGNTAFKVALNTSNKTAFDILEKYLS